MKYLLILILSFSAYSNFIKKEDVSKCEDVTVYTKKKLCGSDCLKIDRSYLCESVKLSKKKIQDLDSPIWGTRSMVTSCLDESDCQEKRNLLNCANERISFVNAEFTEVWCNKIVDYNMVETDEDVIVIDEEKKALYDSKMLKKSNRAKKIARGKSVRAKADNALAYLSDSNDGKTEEEVDAMASSFSDIYDALSKKRVKKAIRLIKKVNIPQFDDLKENLLEILED